MLYAAELFYLQDQRDFPFQKAVLVTARAVAQWCSHFQARLIVPPEKYTVPTEKQGILPTDTVEREAFITELVQWIFANSMVDELFYLLLDDEPIPQVSKVARFDHHDDTCCWFLNLTESEFGSLQNAWQENDLPIDLFYPEQKIVCVPYPGNGIKATVLRLFGAKKCYTPMQWQTRGTKG